VAEELRVKVALLLQREVRDPRVIGVTITRVEMTGDLSQARVFFRCLPGGAASDDVARGLASASGFLRREASRTLRLRHAPELRFEPDDLPEQGQRIDDLLAGLERPADDESE
jgi:ribosome-binding factor A